jgi:hypothetical protein
MKNIQKHGCDHNALILHFRHQKAVLTFFGGGSKNGRLVI